MPERKGLFVPNKCNSIHNDKKLSLPTAEEADAFEMAIRNARAEYESVQRYMAYSHDDILAKIREMRLDRKDRIYLMDGHKELAVEALEKAIGDDTSVDNAQILVRLHEQLTLSRRKYNEKYGKDPHERGSNEIQQSRNSSGEDEIER